LLCRAAEISLTHTQPDGGIPPTAPGTNPTQQPQDDPRQAIPAVFSMETTRVYFDTEGQPRDPLDSARGIVHGLLLACVLDTLLVLVAAAWWLLR
jgi:hypothetical protein